MAVLAGHIGIYLLVAFATYVLCMLQGRGLLAALAFFTLAASPFVAAHFLGWYALLTVLAGWISGAKTAAYGRKHPVR